MEPTFRKAIVSCDFSLPFTISQATSLAHLQLLSISAATTRVTYTPNFENTLTFFELKESASFGRVTSQGTQFKSVL